MLTGEQSLDQRRRSVARFKTHPDCWVLLASTRVASEGLTLTEANRVIFVNRWWNPSTAWCGSARPSRSSFTT